MCRRLPQPIPHLVVERRDFARLEDVRVIAQPVEELRTIGLEVDGVKFVVFDVAVVGGALGRRVRIGTHRSLPDSGHGAQGSEVAQGIGVSCRFSEDVGAIVVAGHLRPPCTR